MTALYHFTTPENLFFISATGLEPRATEAHGFMTGGVPVVWLTQRDSNLITADDWARIVATRGFPDDDRKVGDPMFGCNESGSVRLTVHIERHNKKLYRCRDTVDAPALAFRPYMLEWWVYTGMIKPKKIELDGIPLSEGILGKRALPGIDWHIATHPNFAFRKQLVELRAKAVANPDQLVQVQVADDLAA